ncbi:hypothetical protein FOA43_002506 [Brettanomyces nanus]|uniref:TECPR1-like DysF domain-containing protein n=1 Tax=Eeniella nana TaxID=13502 RepID=A0A875S055_EENNA|nr:uncharacterized protein FOA43_002506 [Brettanomyces nanus]QPG75161.1 hypothetical protein FOA43_002506 [Brettanomyces nanus]
MANSVASPVNEGLSDKPDPTNHSETSSILNSTATTSSYPYFASTSSLLHHHVMPSNSNTDRLTKSTSSFLDELFGTGKSKTEGSTPKKSLGGGKASKKPNKRSKSPATKGSFAGARGDSSVSTAISGISPVSNIVSSTEIGNPDSAEGLVQTYTQQMADKFMQRIINMAMPNTTTQDERELESVLSRIEMQKSRPPLNVQAISKNSIALLQRLSIPFCIIDQIIVIFNWSNPVYTLSLLFLTTLMILKPITIVTFPLFMLCYQVILPAFIRRHPIDPVDGSLALGPQLNSIEYPKPVPELSREFLLNVTDLQNHVLIYVISWNYVNRWIIKYLYFKDEFFSTFVFMVTFCLALFLCFFGTPLLLLLLPVLKVAAVALVWCFTVALHPKNRTQILEWMYSEDTRLRVLTMTNRLDSKLAKELDWRESKEICQLEIFELQVMDSESKIWQPVCFTDDIYPMNSYIRLSNMPINGCSSLSNISPPEGWRFIDEKSVGSSHKMTKSSSAFSQLGKSNEDESGNAAAEFTDFKVTAATISALTPASTPDLSTLKRHRKTPSNEKGGFSAAKALDGWYLDLRPNSWVQQNYLDGVLDVDEDSKWCYDKVSTESGATIRGDFRRRRWIRYCIRSIWSEEINDDIGDQSNVEEDFERSQIEDDNEDDYVGNDTK